MSFFLIYIDGRGPYPLCGLGNLHIVLDGIFTEEEMKDIRVIAETGDMIELSREIKFLRDRTLTVYPNNSKPVILKII